MSRVRFRCEIEQEIKDLKMILSGIEGKDRLHVIAEALMDLNNGDIKFQSTGCYDWDITMDYRNSNERRGK